MNRLWSFLCEYFARLRQFQSNIRLFILGQFLVGLGMTLWGLFFNLFLDAKGYDKAFIGSTLALSNVGVALFAIPAGLMVIRGEPRRLLLVSQLLSSLCYVGVLLASGSTWLQGFIFFASGFTAFTRVVAGPLIMRNSSGPERTYIFSVNFIVGYAGSIFGNALAGTFKSMVTASHFSVADGYRYAILGGLALSLSGLVPYLLMRSTEESKSVESSTPLRFAIRNFDWGFFAKALIPSSLISIGAGLIVQFMNLYFKDVFGVSDDLIGILMALQAATMVVGVLFSPVLAERLGRVNTVVLTQLVSLPFMIGLGVTQSLWVAAACFVARGALMNMSAPVSNAMMLELSKPEQQGFLNAMMAVAWALSWSFSAYVYGHLLKGNYTFSFFVAAGLYLVSSLLYFVFFNDLLKEKATRDERCLATKAL